MQFLLKNKRPAILAAVAAFFAGAGLLSFLASLKPVDAAAAQVRVFQVKAGDGFREISDGLAEAGLVRSGPAFKLLAILKGEASSLKPGVYELSQAMSSGDILGELVSGSHREVSVTIPEGASIYDIDRILSDAGVINKQELAKAQYLPLEGELFPDTYDFFTASDIGDVLSKFSDNFNKKAAPLLAETDAADRKSILILASIVQREVPDKEEQKIVAGILNKRIKAGIPLQVDAAICYIKKALAYPAASGCYPLSPLDFKIDSPYNTYLHGGLPPGTIGNPGVSAIEAALKPKNSPYWYYLSDPKTERTVFAKTLEEQNKNRKIYLGL